jgi:REP element-mobilizing transposase RayT
MGRMPRKLSNTGIYHVMFRGINKQDIFWEESDYIKMIEILQLVKEIKKYEIYAYCLMSNHVHIIIKEKEPGDISSILKRILVRYVMWYNWKYERCGRLISNRYISIPVEVDNYFLNLIRYIHQNPLKVGKNIEYKWSSYLEYSDRSCYNITDCYFALSIISKGDFNNFHSEEEKGVFEPPERIKIADADIRKYINNKWRVSPEKISSMPKKDRNNIIEVLVRMYSARQISRITGISRRIIQKVPKKERPHGTTGMDRQA